MGSHSSSSSKMATAVSSRICSSCQGLPRKRGLLSPLFYPFWQFLPAKSSPVSGCLAGGRALDPAVEVTTGSHCHDIPQLDIPPLPSPLLPASPPPWKHLPVAGAAGASVAHPFGAEAWHSLALAQHQRTHLARCHERTLRNVCNTFSWRFTYTASDKALLIGPKDPITEEGGCLLFNFTLGQNYAILYLQMCATKLQWTKTWTQMGRLEGYHSPCNMINNM